MTRLRMIRCHTFVICKYRVTLLLIITQIFGRPITLIEAIISAIQLGRDAAPTPVVTWYLVDIFCGTAMITHGPVSGTIAG